ncbi:MAG TPA: HlyD family secretion protein [Caulobacteraceae bacterium]|jgi:membrane fusion protein (multidrug efflux system)
MAQEHAAKDEAPKKPSPFRNPLVLAGIGVVVVIVVIVALVWWLNARRWQATDDAYVDGHIVRLAPQISGVVVKVYVTDNARVRAGQPLVDIDPQTFGAQYRQASAQAAQSEAQIGQQRAQVTAARATYQQAISDAAAVAAQARQAADDLARFRNLRATAPGAVSAQQFDQALQAARNTAAQHRSALEKADNAAAEIRAAEAQIKSFEAQHVASQAQAQQSRITLGDTRLSAPFDGHIANLNIAPGGFVQPGQELMAVVPDKLWITANFKETQLDLMRIGQRADVKVDACSAPPYRAHVDSIQRGAGQAFALLPPQNATGNFVKVVQRVPVKIVFDRLPQDCPLGPGMSAVPKVLVRP